MPILGPGACVSASTKYIVKPIFTFIRKTKWIWNTDSAHFVCKIISSASTPHYHFSARLMTSEGNRFDKSDAPGNNPIGSSEFVVPRSPFQEQVPFLCGFCLYKLKPVGESTWAVHCGVEVIWAYVLWAHSKWRSCVLFHKGRNGIYGRSTHLWQDTGKRGIVTLGVVGVSRYNRRLQLWMFE